MKSLLTQDNHSSNALPALASSRRSWLKGLGALLGTGLLAASPTAVFAAPAAPADDDALAASALVGGDEYIGIVKILAGSTVPAGWAACHGQLLEVAQHPALFAIIGAHYGGDGHRTFALPDLRESWVTPAGAATAEPLPAKVLAIKVANAVATTNSLGELRLRHHGRARAGQTS
jgi:hypothetical protein